MMSARLAILVGSLIAASPLFAADKAVSDPAAAIAAADASRDGQAKGRFAMTVAAVGRVSSAVYVNSSADYRSSDNLTFTLTPTVDRGLMRKYGASTETYLPGKRIVVDGVVRRVPIVNKKYSRVQSFNRWAHQVTVRLPSQIVSVE